MTTHTHHFVEAFEGFIGFGLNAESDMDTVVYYLQKFSDDQLMQLLRTRLSHEDRQAIFDLLSALLRKHLSEAEYHRLFLKDNP
ncbi:MAG: cytoplasmic protein [Desulfosarcina sp.]